MPGDEKSSKANLNCRLASSRTVESISDICMNDIVNRYKHNIMFRLLRARPPRATNFECHAIASGNRNSRENHNGRVGLSSLFRFSNIGLQSGILFTWNKSQNASSLHSPFDCILRQSPNHSLQKQSQSKLYRFTIIKSSPWPPQDKKYWRTFSTLSDAVWSFLTVLHGCSTFNNSRKCISKTIRLAVSVMEGSTILGEYFLTWFIEKQFDSQLTNILICYVVFVGKRNDGVPRYFDSGYKSIRGRAIQSGRPRRKFSPKNCTF